MTDKPIPDRTQQLRAFSLDLEQLLLRQLAEKPELDDVRVKLLELYFEQHRQDDFTKAARAFHRRLRNPEQSREWQRVASMGRMLAPDQALFSGAGSDRIEFIEAPDAKGAKAPPQRFQRFGDDDSHLPLFHRLAERYDPIRKDPRFLAELELLLVSLPTRRPTPVTHAKRLSEHLGGAQVHIKREDLADDNPHLVIAVAGQALVARRLGCKTLVTATTDGRRGLIAATVAARLGLRTVVFMDTQQAERAAANTMFMHLLGAELRRVKASQYRNGDVREAALQHWARNPEETFLLMGLDAAPPPYPVMTQEFTAAIGRECRRQLTAGGKPLPALIATRGSSSADALGLFPAFLKDTETRLVCVEPEPEPGAGPAKLGDPYHLLGKGLTADEKKLAQNILDRLEYPSVAREHAMLKASGRVEYVQATRAAARQALQELAQLEGILAPVATAHALAWTGEAARALKPQQSVVIVMAEHVENLAWDIHRLLEDGAQAPPGP